MTIEAYLYQYSNTVTSAASFHVDLKSAVPIYAQLVQECRKAVLLGRFKPGDLLPSIRQLAVDLAINPNTVVRAYQVLETQGIASARKGMGYYITERAPALCRREAGTADLDRLSELVARLNSNGVSETQILVAVRIGLKNSRKSRSERERHQG